MKKQAAAPKARRPKKEIFPRGWDKKRVKDVIAYYEKQTEDEEVAEYQAAMKVQGQTVMLVLTKLVPGIRRLIARQQGM